MEKRQTLRQATKLWQEAYRYQMEGELDRAIECYRRSIEAHPTAEAHTFLGWAMSFQGRFEEATEECLRARSSSTQSSAIRITTSGPT